MLWPSRYNCIYLHSFLYLVGLIIFSVCFMCEEMGSLDDLVQYRMARYMAFSVCRGLDRLSWIPKTADNFVNLERH